MPLIEVNTDEAEKKLSVFRRYYYEVGIIVLAIVCSYLFVGQKTLERDMRNYLINDRISAIQIIQQNTDVMKDVKNVLIDNSGTLRRIEQENMERNLKGR